MTPFERGFLKQAVCNGLAEHEAYSWLKVAADLSNMPKPSGPMFESVGGNHAQLGNMLRQHAPVLNSLAQSGGASHTANPGSARMAFDAKLNQRFGAGGVGGSGLGVGSPVGSLGNVVQPNNMSSTAMYGRPVLTGHGTPINQFTGWQQQPMSSRPSQGLSDYMPEGAAHTRATAVPKLLTNFGRNALKGGVAGGVTAAGLDALSPTQENNGNYWHDVVNQLNDTTKSIVGGGTAGALAGGGVGAVPGAIGGGIYDIANKAVAGGRDLWDIGKMTMDSNQQEEAVKAMEDKLRLAQGFKTQFPWSSGNWKPQMNQELGRLSGRTLSPEELATKLQQ